MVPLLNYGEYVKKYILGLVLLLSQASFAALKHVPVTLSKDNMLVLNDPFEADTASKVAQAARELDAKSTSNEPIYLVLDTPGGSIGAGMELITNLNNLNRPVHTITIFSASMGFQTVQGVKGDRLMVEHGTLMSHKARGGVSGEFPGQLDSRYSWILSVVNDLDKKVAARTAGKHTTASYQALIENEYWCTPEHCANNGLIDGIADVKCDASLNGKHDKVVEQMAFAGITIQLVATLSDCPIITGPLEMNVLVNGKNVFKNDGPRQEFTSEQTKIINDFNLKAQKAVLDGRKIDYYRK
jgi:ATP-dependent Clp protease protease subunit